MSNKPEDERENANQPTSSDGGGELTQNDIPRKDRHSSTPREDAEWEERMDELDVERDDLYNNETVRRGTIDLRELARIVRWLETLAAASKQLGEEKTRFDAHLEQALFYLNQAASELAQERRN